MFVQGGGCSGFQYGLMIEENARRRRPDVRVERHQAVRRSGEPQLPEGRRSRFRRHDHRRRLHDQEPERDVDLRLRVVVQRLTRAPGFGLRDPAGHAEPRTAELGPRPRTSARPRSAASGRHQALRQARSDRQRVPPPGGTPQRRRSRRSDQARRSAHQPRHGLPHAAVDGRRGRRAQGRFRRRPLPLRAFVPPSAPLPSDLQDLQSLVRVPQLRHRGAGRRGRRPRAASPRGRASCRFTARASRAAPAGRRPKKARRASCSSRATRCALRLPPSAAGSSSTPAPRASPRIRAGGRCSSVSPKRRSTTSARSRQRYQKLLEQDPQLESRPTFLFFKGAANGLFARGADELLRDGINDREAYKIGIRCERGSHRFFKRYGERFEDSEGKQIFLEFADEERDHLEMLIREYRALTRRQRKRKAKPGRAGSSRGASRHAALPLSDRSPPPHHRVGRSPDATGTGGPGCGRGPDDDQRHRPRHRGGACRSAPARGARWHHTGAGNRDHVGAPRPRRPHARVFLRRARSGAAASSSKSNAPGASSACREIGERLARLGAPIDVERLLDDAAAPARRVGRASGRGARAHRSGPRQLRCRTRSIGISATGQPAFVPRIGAVSGGGRRCDPRAGGLASMAHPGVTRQPALIDPLVDARTRCDRGRTTPITRPRCKPTPCPRPSGSTCSSPAAPTFTATRTRSSARRRHAAGGRVRRALRVA